MPEDSEDNLWDIAKTFGVERANLDVRVQKNFDLLKDEEDDPDEAGEEIALYSAKPR